MKKGFALIVLIFVSGFIYSFNTKENTVFVEQVEKREAAQDSFKVRYQELDKYYSEKQLGCIEHNGEFTFRLFAPSAEKIRLCVFNRPEDAKGDKYDLIKDSDGVWEIIIEKDLYGKFYGYQSYMPGEDTTKEKPVCVDPYAKAVTTQWTYMNPHKAIITKAKDYDWEGTNWLPRDWRDLVIYEMHIKDMTAHSSSGANERGTYKGLVEKGNVGGINYIKSLGVNAVELLPAQEFGNLEIPYKKRFAGRYNNWNPYGRNHWGYMTSAYFAPESYYSMAGTPDSGEWIGKEGRQVNDFKDMVKAFHKEGVSVIMDVVYNHLSEYEIGNLKEIDKEYYFRMDDNGNFISESYCGNDLKTERPMTRRMIIESLKYWMTEYKVDGFRFDLGKLLDWKTIEEIITEARKINPDVIIVGEPWGGGYDPAGFSHRGWGSWNDQIRNGVKGENPHNGLGWIFGHWYGNNNPDRIKSYVNGTLARDTFGLFQKKEHSVNYLESHDGYTLGDFIRIASREVDPNKTVADINKNAKLTPHQLKLNKLAAMFLFTSQGITMLHEGQEFARSKVIPMDVAAPDSLKGLIDHNTYNKDNEANYINYTHALINKELVDYYKGLIEIRNTYPAFRRAEYKDVKFAPHMKEFTLAYTLAYGGEEFVIVFNADQKHGLTYVLPEGEYETLADSAEAGLHLKKSISGKVKLEPVSGCILKKVK
jgi:pullulanase/glycogen debranching enzyme